MICNIWPDISSLQMGQTQTKEISHKRRQKFEAKREYFVKNGGVLLEKQMALSQGKDIGAGQLKIFTNEEIENATDYYNPDFLVGYSMYITVYTATLDDRIVAVKTPLSKEPDPELVNRCLVEASMAVVLNHENIVKLYGCCLETYVPIQVYEFLPNSSLFYHLHSDVASVKSIKWVDCLRAVTDTAYALAYMHNALSKPVVHRDVNSSSVLLDHSFRGRLANFGYSVTITPGETPKKWPVEGTPGYIDPEYIETQEVTNKCDVYSFGVLMLELLTRRQPLLMARDGDDLVDGFVLAVGKDCMMEMIDSRVLEQASKNDVQQIARLALACVAMMVTIVEQLRQMQRSRDN